MNKMQNKTSIDAEMKAPLGGKTAVDRSTLLTLLGEVLKKQHAKVLNGRIRNEKTCKLRLESARVFAYVASVYGGILKDKDLSDILKRLDALEETQNAKQ
jgi:hypothetical protein